VQHVEVIIIGAGLAGLYAAMQLTKRQIPYVLLEANDHIGGRIQGYSAEQSQERMYDLGPTWVFPHQEKIQALVKDLGLELFSQYIEGDALFQRAGATSPERFTGAGAMDLFRIKHGTYALIGALVSQSEEKNIRLNHPVKALTRQGETWQLDVNANKESVLFSCNNLVLAIPPRMAATHLTCRQWASPSLINAFQTCQTWMSAQAKCVISYAHPFWRERELSGQTFSQVGPMVEMHDASVEENGSYALFGFIGWPYEQRKQHSLETLKQRCIEQLIWLYGDAASQYTDCIVKDWATESWVASPADVNEPSQHPNFRLSLYKQELEALNLHLVGSEFAQTDPGYLEGAIDAVDRSIENLL
jgi:monoamine oxidase